MRASMVPKGIKSLREFWPHYLREHLNPTSRRLHFIGTALVVMIFLAALWRQEWHWLWVMPLAGYFFAWVGHFFFERNRPATFSYPFFSLACDFYMFWLTLTGRLKAELQRVQGKEFS